jgi:hypothetical protein
LDRESSRHRIKPQSNVDEITSESGRGGSVRQSIGLSVWGFASCRTEPGMSLALCERSRELFHCASKFEAARVLGLLRSPSAIPARGPELRVLNVAAQAGIVSVARIRLDSGNLRDLSKG